MRKQFEYLLTSIDESKGAYLEQHLNIKGMDGWELVHLYTHPLLSWFKQCIFKREKITRLSEEKS